MIEISVKELVTIIIVGINQTWLSYKVLGKLREDNYCAFNNDLKEI